MSKKNFNAATLSKLRNFTSSLITSKDAVLVGFSGGADSVCLLHFLNYLSKEKHFPLAALHVNHGLRGQDALNDQNFCKEFCIKNDIEFFCKAVKVKELATKLDLSPEHAARKARYEAFVEVSKKWGATKLALGHHLDDQVETILLNILRGTKAKGLVGIPLQRPLTKGIQIVRPLLCLARKDIEDYLQNNNLTHITDKSNFEEVFTRNWIRQTLLPLLETKQPQIRAHLYAIAHEIEALLNKKNI